MSTEIRTDPLTLEVILRTVIGASDPARLSELRELLAKLLTISAWQTIAVANPKLQRYRPWRRLRENLGAANRLLFAEIAERRADPNLADRTDALSMLVRAEQMSDVELRDQLMTLLVAGHDTTATALSLALERLTRHPDILHAAVAAAHASAAGDPAGDDYLDAIGKEVLRVRPVVFDIGRVLTAPTEVAGHRLPAGVMVAPGIGLIHASAASYPDPERFDPVRMLGGAPGPTTWLPFGGGNRRCLGATFALAELKIVLREVLRRVDLATTTAVGERQRVKAVILVPHRGARIRVIAKHRDVVEGVADVSTDTRCPVAHDQSRA